MNEIIEKALTQTRTLAKMCEELIEERNKAVARYECVRCLSAREFSEIDRQCIQEGARFDDVIDERIKAKEIERLIKSNPYAY